MTLKELFSKLHSHLYIEIIISFYYSLDKSYLFQTCMLQDQILQGRRDFSILFSMPFADVGMNLLFGLC